MFNSSIEKVRLMRLGIGYDYQKNGEKPVGGSFYIPKYQRGYRWSQRQVTELLEDIVEFRPSEDPDDQYCLQPIVVMKRKDTDQWVVVDGQQRLTTIFIILSCLRCLERKPKRLFYKIDYESKPELWECLEKLGDKPDLETDYSDIDKYHITNAYQTVCAWIRKKVNSADEEEDYASELGKKIRSRVCVIWYEISGEDENKPEEIFTRINMGKIPLTNAELIKALLLKKDNFNMEDRAKGAQIRISVSWDLMEYGLHKKEFWLFLTNDKNDERDVRIELIFDIMARHFMNGEQKIAEFEKLRETNPNAYLFHIYSGYLKRMIEAARENAEKTGLEYDYETVLDKFWQDISNYYQMLQDWYDNREWYHLIGYLIAAREHDNRKTDIGEFLYNLSVIYKKESKSSFTKELKQLIFNDIKRQKTDDNSLDNLTCEDLEESFSLLRYNNGMTDKNRIHNILLLFNVVTAQKSTEKMSRFPFHEYKKTKWNLEHIHSVTTAIPGNEKDCKEWAEEVWKYLVSVHYFRDDENKNISKRLRIMLDEGKGFSRDNQEFMDLFTDISETFSSGKLSSERLEELENGIMNMALLDEHTNKSYKNAIFPMKRKHIMGKMGKDDFVPICTKNVFLKYYTDEVTQFYVWDENDRICYYRNICSLIFEYLTGKASVPGKTPILED